MKETFKRMYGFKIVVIFDLKIEPDLKNWVNASLKLISFQPLTCFDCF